jgi:tRNA threonylcarbamoyladenosine biosynthesis protein TsaB
MTTTEKDIPGVHEPVVLALETATMCGSVALVAGKQCVAEFSLRTGETHSRRLLSGLDYILQEAGIEKNNIDAVAVSVGPGSFTGLRIGMATAKGLATAAKAKLIGIGTLDGLAAQFYGTGDMLICPVLDARKKEVYCGFYRCNKEGITKALDENKVLSPEALCAMIGESVLMAGDGMSVYGDYFREKLGSRLQEAPAGIHFPRAATIGLLALNKWDAGEFLDPVTAEPVYIRPSEAEIQFGNKA